MLILTRNIGETIRIADDITIQVLSLSGQQVKLGLSAPAEIVIMREELLESTEDSGPGDVSR